MRAGSSVQEIVSDAHSVGGQCHKCGDPKESRHGFSKGWNLKEGSGRLSLGF